MGVSPKGSHVSGLPSSGLPLLNGPTEFGSVYPTALQWASQWSREAEPGDVLFCVRGSTTGRMNRAQTKYAIGRGIAAVRGPTPVDTDFLYYALVDGLDDLLSLTSGSVFPNISAGDLRAFDIPWPDEYVRTGVVATLGAIDDKIESNQRQIDLSLALLDLYAVQLAITERPLVPLREIVSVSRIAADPARMSDKTVDHFSIPAFDDRSWPERIQASSIMSNKLLIEQTSILVSRINPRINRTWWCVPTEGIPALASTEFIVLATASLADLGALWLAVRDEYFMNELKRRVTGTSGSHQRIRPDDLLAIEVPDVRTLHAAEKERALDLLILVHQKRAENRRLTAVRDVLLPELLSGRMRIPAAAEALEEGTHG